MIRIINLLFVSFATLYPGFSYSGEVYVHADSESNADIDINYELRAAIPAGKDKIYAIGVCNVCHTSKSNAWSRPPHTGD